MKGTRASAKKPAKAAQKREAAQQRLHILVSAFLMNGGNITQAGLVAGFAPRSAAQQASRMLKSDEAQQLLLEARKNAAQKAELDLNDLARSLRQAILFDPRKLYRPDGTLKAIAELDDDTALALTGIEVSEESTTAAGQTEPARVKSRTAKVAWERKGPARDQLARILGAYEKDNRQRTDPLVALLAELAKRPSAIAIGQDNSA